MAGAPCPPAVPAELPDAEGLAAALGPALGRRRAADAAGAGRRAAVLLVLYDRNDRPHLLLTKRSDSVPSHPGQISLPGGVREPDDRSLERTAVRETEEEVGLPADALRVLGRLDDVPTMVSGFIVRPFVAVLSGPLAPRPSDAEVARVMQVPVLELLRADAALPPDPPLLRLRYPLADEDVWGATARILRTFCRVLRCALAER